MTTTFFSFIFRSSKDPRATSATIKYAALGLIPYTMQVLGIACALGSMCIDIDQTLLERIVDTLSEFIFMSLTLVSGIGFVFGLGRKLIRTFEGTNLAIK